MPRNRETPMVPIYFPSFPSGAKSAAYAMAIGITIEEPIPWINLITVRENVSHARTYRRDTIVYTDNPKHMIFFLLLTSDILPIMGMNMRLEMEKAEKIMPSHMPDAPSCEA